MRTIFDIKKLDCQSCALMIEGICEDVTGVQSAEVNSRQRRLTVDHLASGTTEEVVTALAAEGYPVEVIQTTE